MAWVNVQTAIDRSTNVGDNDATHYAYFSSTPTDGNLLVACIFISGQTSPRPDFFKGPPPGWTTIGSYNGYLGNSHSWFGYKIASGDSSTFAISSGTAQNVGHAMVVSEFSGNAAESVLDQTGSLYRYNDFSEAFLIAGPETAAADALWLYLFSEAGVEKQIAPTAPFTPLGTPTIGSSTNDGVAAIAAYHATGAETRGGTYTWTGGMRRSGQIFTFNPGGGGGKVLDRGIRRGITRGIFNG